MIHKLPAKSKLFFAAGKETDDFWETLDFTLFMI